MTGGRKVSVGEPTADLPHSARDHFDWHIITATVRATPGLWVPLTFEGISGQNRRNLAHRINHIGKGTPAAVRDDTSGTWEASTRDDKVYVRFTPTPRNGRAAKK